MILTYPALANLMGLYAAICAKLIGKIDPHCIREEADIIFETMTGISGDFLRGKMAKVQSAEAGLYWDAFAALGLPKAILRSAADRD